MPPQQPDPRVHHDDGPHPNTEGLRALVADVHEQLDGLGVPRRVEGAEFTLLGRVSFLLATYRIERA